MEITLDDIQKWQPESEIENSTDEYYLMLAQYVDKMWKSMGVFPEIDEDIRKGVIVALVSYYQDVVADFGIWRSFVQFCRKEYQKPLPFYDEPENYVDFELNLEDLQFVIWYSLESQLGFQGLVSPFDSDLLRLARQVFKLFDFLYADAPAPEKFREFSEVDLDDREQVADIFRLSGWLFWNSYFLRPTSKFAYEPEVSEDDELSIAETLTDEKRLRTTFEKPTGPLALYVEEWMRLMIDNRLPKEKAIFDLKMNTDQRGSFTELVHTLNCGQVSINISKPGIIKGQHWHHTKWEQFIVVSGHGLIQMRKEGTDEVIEYEVNGDRIQSVIMLPGYTHNIINLSDTQDLVTVMYCNEVFNPERPDTFFDPVVKE